MMDMVKLLHEVDNEDLPCFVAKDLAKLPPIDTTHIDVSTLMVELKSLRREVAQMKDIAVRPEVTDLANELGLLRKEISEVKSCVDGLKKPEKVHVESDVISQMARYELPAVCEPLDFHCPLNKDPHTSSYADVVQSRAPAVKAKCPTQSDRLPTKASENLSVNREGEFTVVSRRSKRRPPPVIGTAKFSEESTIKAVRSHPPFKFFITRFAPTTTPEAVISFIKNRCQVIVKCEQLKTKYDTYASFLIETTREFADKIRDPAIWPTGILVRRYY
ncbi:uncharacterized protein [Ptychodera flava]|uniref:uncharacterized protein n=1 Tax=Ptychodera flava TaxID=63121 RepID=UPI00396A81E0